MEWVTFGAFALSIKNGELREDSSPKGKGSKIRPEVLCVPNKWEGDKKKINPSAHILSRISRTQGMQASRWR